MSKAKGTIVVRFALRDSNYLSDKYIKELQKDIPFDMEVVSSINCKKVDVHRFVVMMFSKHIRNVFKDSGNSYKNGHVIIPVNVPYGILLKVIELFYDCQTIIPANSVSDMHKALHFLQVDSVMDFGQMPPPMNAPNSGPRPMYTDAQAAFNRRQTMINMEPMIDLKRRRTNMVPIPAQIRPSFEQARMKPLVRQQNVSKSGPVQPVAAARNVSVVPISRGDNGSAYAPASEHGQNKLYVESHKVLVEKMEPPNDGDSNKENARPQLNLDIDISNDETFKDMMTNLEAEMDLKY